MRALMFEIWQLTLAMAPYLLLGFGIAGVLKVLIPESFLLKHLSGKKFSSVLKAAMIGVPLPLCSCGVIPVTAHLKKAGAGKGAILSFLTSTPTTGVDSILATVSLLGWPFALLRTGASFFIGILSGVVTNIFTTEEENLPAPEQEHVHDGTKSCCLQKKGHIVPSIFKYAFMELIDDVGKWIIIGLVFGGLISYFVPANFCRAVSWQSFDILFANVVDRHTYVCLFYWFYSYSRGTYIKRDEPWSGACVPYSRACDQYSNYIFCCW